jgi:hypothetical protein
MSTHDVPGANPKNADALGVGCWAEHNDGSLIFVKSTEGGRVIYEIFDMADDPATVYTDAMGEGPFKKFFSFPPAGTSKIEWTWHDKTPFPWDRIVKTTKRPAPSFATADDQLNAAQKVVASLKRRGQNVAEKRASREAVGHLVESPEESRGMAVMRRLAAALDTFMSAE